MKTSHKTYLIAYVLFGLFINFKFYNSHHPLLSTKQKEFDGASFDHSYDSPEVKKQKEVILSNHQEWLSGVYEHRRYVVSLLLPLNIFLSINFFIMRCILKSRE